MFGTQVIFVISVVFVICESASILKNKKKCEIKDNECQRNLYRSILENIRDTGDADLGIPSIDPFELKDAEISVLNMIKLISPEGVVKGFKSCTSKSFRVDKDKQVTSVDLTCEVFSIESKYIIKTTPVLDALIGGIKIHGEGKGSVSLENLEINLEVPFEIKKLDGCDAHFVLDSQKITYTFKVLGKVVVAADNILVGSQEISSVVVNIFNENWQFLSQTLGRPVIDKGLEIFVKYANIFFAEVPANDLVSDDLSSYITN